jgi:hypothetical protein
VIVPENGATRAETRASAQTLNLRSRRRVVGFARLIRTNLLFHFLRGNAFLLCERAIALGGGAGKLEMRVHLAELGLRLLQFAIGFRRFDLGKHLPGS